MLKLDQTTALTGTNAEIGACRHNLSKAAQMRAAAATALLLGSLGTSVHVQAAQPPTATFPDWWSNRQFPTDGHGIALGGANGAASATINIENREQADYTKYVFIDVFWRPVNTGELVTLKDAVITWPGASGSYFMTLSGQNIKANGDGYYESWFSYAITPQPEKESIVLRFQTPVSVDVTFDYQAGTYCVPAPEPETYGMLLAGLGLMGLVARRRKS